jgi:hypothetical protein
MRTVIDLGRNNGKAPLPCTRAVGTEEPLLVQLAILTIHVAFMQRNNVVNINGGNGGVQESETRAAFLALRHQSSHGHPMVYVCTHYFVLHFPK